MYDTDYLGGAVQFKVDGIGYEALQEQIPAYDRDYQTWDRMFSDSTPLKCGQ